MALNYKNRLEKLEARRFDPLLQKSIVTNSYFKSSIPEDLKYLAESMMPIETAYNKKTIEAATNVKTHLERELTLTFKREYRNQGSVMTDTNIKTHSDIDLLTLVDDYAYVETISNNPYKGNPDDDINSLYSQAVAILKRHYDVVDDTGKKSISIFNKNLRRKVDIVPCYWYNTDAYQASSNQLDRGVYLYDFKKKVRSKIDYPFSHIHQVDSKGESTYDGSRKGIRLVKSLKADSDEKITLTSFELTTIVHDIRDGELVYFAGDELKIAENISAKLKRLIDDPALKATILSPNGRETPLTNVTELQLRLLKADLDELIMDCRSELKNAYFEKAFKNYRLQY